jgi:hypothetical protein
MILIVVLAYNIMIFFYNKSKKEQIFKVTSANSGLAPLRL